MNDFDAQMTLDLYIHDYLVRNNMHTVAQTFSQEAKFQPMPVAVDDGLLSDWWSIFWDVYCSGTGNDPAAPTSMPHQSCADVPPNPDPNYIVQNLDPMLNAVTSMLNTLNSPPSHDMLAQLPNLLQAEAEMGSVEEPFRRKVDPMLNAPNSHMLGQLPNLPQAEAGHQMKEMGSQQVHVRKPPRIPDPAIKAMADSHQFSLRPETGSPSNRVQWVVRNRRSALARNNDTGFRRPNT